MPDIPTAAEVTRITGLLAPGIVIIWIRSRFLETVPPKLAEKMTIYAVISIAYNAVSYPLFHADGWVQLPVWLWQLLSYFLLPLLVGVVLAFFDQSERFYDWTRRVGLQPVHHIATAWDYTFRHRTASYVLVHLTDGSEIAGAWVGGSFASSVPGDRDILIDQMWKVEDGGWKVLDPARSILICGGTVRMIEFIEGATE